MQTWELAIKERRNEIKRKALTWSPNFYNFWKAHVGRQIFRIFDRPHFGRRIHLDSHKKPHVGRHFLLIIRIHCTLGKIFAQKIGKLNNFPILIFNFNIKQNCEQISSALSERIECNTLHILFKDTKLNRIYQGFKLASRKFFNQHIMLKGFQVWKMFNFLKFPEIEHFCVEVIFKFFFKNKKLPIFTKTSLTLRKTS